MSEVLLIEDDPDHRELYSAMLLGPGLGWNVSAAATKAEALSLIGARSFDCIILDYRISGDDGFVFLHELRRDLKPCPPVIFLTAALDESLRRNAEALGAFACFDKLNMRPEQLLLAVHNATRRSAA